MPETIDAPLPSKELIWRVTDTEDAEWFHTSGRRSLEDLRCAVGVARRDLESFRRVLDFGCGAGRMLRWAGELAETIEVHGVDIDADAIAWCRENLPFARCEVGPWEPPLPYPDAHFDLVHGHSVFTHLPEHYQDLWLGELERITQPGGCSYSRYTASTSSRSSAARSRPTTPGGRP